MKNNKFIIFAWILMSGIYSCTKENINQLSLDVKLTGKVELHSQFGEKLDNYEAVTILLDDAQNKSEYVLNEEGYYHISGIKTGVYNLTITANGFVTRQIKGLQLLVVMKPFTKTIGYSSLHRLLFRNFILLPMKQGV